MDFFELLKQGNYTIEESDESLWKCWPSSRIIFLRPDSRHSIWMTYNIETLLIYTVLIIIDTEKEEVKNTISYRWLNPATRSLFENDDDYTPSYHGNEIMIEDEDDMNFVTLKMKYM